MREEDGQRERIDSTAQKKTAERSEKLDLLKPDLALEKRAKKKQNQSSLNRPAATSNRPAIYDEIGGEDNREAAAGRRSNGSGGGNERDRGARGDRGDRRGRRSPPQQRQWRRSSPQQQQRGEKEAIYIPPFKLARMLGDTTDREGEAFQRLSWEALRKVNKRIFFFFFSSFFIIRFTFFRTRSLFVLTFFLFSLPFKR